MLEQSGSFKNTFIDYAFLFPSNPTTTLRTTRHHQLCKTGTVPPLTPHCTSYIPFIAPFPFLLRNHVPSPSCMYSCTKARCPNQINQSINRSIKRTCIPPPSITARPAYSKRLCIILGTRFFLCLLFITQGFDGRGGFVGDDCTRTTSMSSGFDLA